MSIKTLQEVWEFFKIADEAKKILDVCSAANFSDRLKLNIIQEMGNLAVEKIPCNTNKGHFINALTLFLSKGNILGLPGLVLEDSFDFIMGLYKIEKTQDWKELSLSQKIEQLEKDIKMDLEGL